MNDEKTILVSGASGGIGKAGVEILAKNGFIVYAGVLNNSEISELERIDRNIKPIVLDVADDSSISDVTECIRTEVNDRNLFGIWANAGVTCVSSFKNMNLGQIRKVVEVNLLGNMLFIHSALPFLKRNESRVVLTGSATGMFAAPAVSVYTATKWALEGFCDALRIELSRSGIALSLVQPGLVRTGMTEGTRSSVEALLEGFSAQDREDYGPLVNKISQLSVAASTPPSDVAGAVLDAFVSRKPKIRYRPGIDAKATAVLRHFPDPVKDFIQRRIFGV